MNDSDSQDIATGTSAKTEQLHELIEQTRADALVTITEHFIASSGDTTQWQGLKGSERCQLMLHVDINTLRRHSHRTEQAHEHCNLDNKHWMSSATARRLSCDTSLFTVLEDERGKVLNIGRRARTVPASIGRALALRDQTCRYHHRQLHEGAFSVLANNSGDEEQLIFSTPSGATIQQGVLSQYESVSAETLEIYLARLAPDVHAGTAVSRWQGEDCDYGMAIDALLRRDGGTQ